MTSKIKVDNITDQGGNNMVIKCGTTQTLGTTGVTVALASGASQTGFGRTGTVDWQTSIQTSASFTAVNGQGFFIDTSSNAITANLPAGTAGSIVAFKDYANNFDTNKLTISPNGSQKINNSTLDLEVTTEGESLTLVYADDTKGWLIVNDGNNDAGAQATYIAATGGTVTTVCTNFKVHTFTGPGTFCVSAVGNAAGSNTVDYLVIAGGAGAGQSGGGNMGGGGGAGGYRESSGAASGCYARSPLGACVSALPVSVQGYPITVGAGGTGHSGTTGSAPFPKGGSGASSIFSTVTSAGGGGGGAGAPTSYPSCVSGNNGGSGGGGSGGHNISPNDASRGSGNTPSVSPPQGNDGGTGGGSPDQRAGGGGGATAVGADRSPTISGPGGAGGTSSINGTPTQRAGGGGGGGGGSATAGTATGGGGAGGAAGSCGSNGTAGTANTGGGGGAGGGATSPPYNAGDSGAGGSGVVIIRYKFQ